MRWKPKYPCLLAGAIGGLLCVQIALAQQDVDDLLEAGAQRSNEARAQQQEINAIVEVTEDLFSDYQNVLREIEDHQVYVNILQAQVDGQNRELNQLYKSIDDVGLIERQILPLMTRMITGLERFIELDVPFLLEERFERVERLKSVLRRSDVTAAQQFNAVLQAWVLEMQGYATQGEIYTDEIVTADGTSREVQLLRIGRIALLYVTPDGTRAGAWDKSTGRFVAVDDLAAEIRLGINAYETGQPALFIAPVAPPEEL